MLNLVANGPSGYTIYNSLRIRASASAYLNRTTGTPTLTTKFTWSGWIKRGQLSTTQVFYSIGQPTTSTNYIQCQINTSDQIVIQGTTSGTSVLNVATVAVFRDPSAWYHVVVSIDTTQATAANRVIVYINGVQQTLTITTQIAQNATIPGNTSGYISAISALNYNGAYQSFFDGYLAEVNFIDGQALTPSSFGITNSFTGVWQPAKYSGTYGTNGFYQKYSSIATTSGSNTGLGQDFSGNGNYWNTNNISVTAGVTYDAMTDVPTLTSATVANYATLNPLKNGGMTLSNGNLTALYAPTAWTSCSSTIAVSSGKWYFEGSMGGISSTAYIMLGIRLADVALSTYLADDANGWGILANSGNIASYTNAAATNSTTFSSTTSTIFQVAIDVDAGKLWLGYNNTWLGGGSPSAGTSPTYTLTANRLIQPVISAYGNTNYINFGQRPFGYSAPTGFVALNTYNLPDSTIKKGNTVMDATLYTGNLTGQSITNAASFKPDLVWIKSRSAATDNKLTDSVRGATLALVSNSTAAETTDLTGMTAFNSNGFTVGASTTYNNTSATYVGWQWQAGQGSTSSNTSGSITSTVSVNASAGFSVATFTCQSSGTGTFGHGLGVAPAFIITKQRASVGGWTCYHQSLGNTNLITLNSTAATSASSTVWNNTSPTSSLVTLGTGFAGAGTMVVYCWAEIAGFSKFGSYTGNGSTDGTFVYTGFRPKYVMIKYSSGAGNWIVEDSVRDTYNPEATYLLPDLSNVEASINPTMDFTANGFKIRTTNGNINTSTGTYVYIAFAENPFKNANAR